jgi:hypothetical protein
VRLTRVEWRRLWELCREGDRSRADPRVVEVITLACDSAVAALGPAMAARDSVRGVGRRSGWAPVTQGQSVRCVMVRR